MTMQPRAAEEPTTYLVKKTYPTSEKHLEFRTAQEKAVREGNVSALLESVEGTVRFISHKYSKGFSKIDIEDLYSAGRLGALIALQHYDLNDASNSSFNTYAFHWIRSYILTEVISFFWGKNRCPVGTKEVSKMFFGYRKAERQIEISGGQITPEAISKILDIPENIVKDLMDIILNCSKKENTDNQVEALYKSIDAKKAKKELSRLDVRSRRIIEMRYFKDLTLKQVGEELGLTKERVRQLETKALEKLHRILS